MDTFEGDGTYEFEEFFDEESRKLQFEEKEEEENQLDEIAELEIENAILKQDTDTKMAIITAQLVCLSKQNEAILEYSNSLHQLLIEGMSD